MSNEVKIKFAKHQKLPEGYSVEWWECDEHYHWVIDTDNYSVCFSSRWQAYRSAWRHYKTYSATPLGQGEWKEITLMQVFMWAGLSKRQAMYHSNKLFKFKQP